MNSKYTKNNPNPEIPKALRDFVIGNTYDALVAIQGSTIVEANDRTALLLGCASKDELIGKMPTLFVTPEYLPIANERLARRISGDTPTDSAIYDCRCKNGELLRVEVSIMPWWPSEPILSVLIVKDVTEREKHLEALRGSERLYRTLIEQMPAGAMLTDHNGTIKYVNSKASKLTGYSIEELCQKINLFHPDETEAHRCYDLAFSDNPTSGTCETRFIRKDSSTMWVSLSWQPVYSEVDGWCCVNTIFTGISEQKKAEAALRRSETRYRGLIESQQDLIVRTTPDGRFTFVNNAYCRMFGKSAEELIGSSFVPLVHTDDLPSTLAAMELLDEPPYRATMEQRAMTVQGWRWLAWEDCAILDSSGNMVEIQAVGRDITENKLAGKALKKSEKRFRTLVANIPGAVFRCKYDEQLTMQYLSYEIEDLTGYPAMEFIGNAVRSFVSVIHPEDTQRVTDAVKAGAMSGKNYVVEYRVVHADGSSKWVMEKGQAVYDADGHTLYIDGIIFDITGRVMAVRALQKAHDDLASAYELQREFLNNVTHEIRTPLTAVKGYVAMLLEGVAGPISDEQKSLLHRVMTSSDHLLELVSGVLEVARLKSGTVAIRPRACNPCLIIDKAISSILPQARIKGIDVLVDQPTNRPLGMYDGDKLSIIITNLLSNAVKFTESGTIEIKVTSNTEGTEIIVVDSGMGIAQSDLETIFDEFQQLDYPRKHKATGFGLGLAIVATMVETINATLTVSSEKDLGTAFTLYAPTLNAQ
ncbi:PAS domain S-box protein [bacterium]|nr:PAS domain S-box protein [bacterium]